MELRQGSASKLKESAYNPGILAIAKLCRIIVSYRFTGVLLLNPLVVE